MIKPKLLKMTLLSLSVGLTACGGGGDDNSANTNQNTSISVIKQGRFIDSAVSGLRYQSGQYSGLTTKSGVFNYEEGKTISFYIGDIKIGETVPKSMITPVDLVSSASNEVNPFVTNIAVFLQSLDKDNNPDNGIEITESVRQTAIGTTINFNQDSTLFINDTNTKQVMTKLASANNQTLKVVDVNSAQTHLKTSLTNPLAKYMGTYKGRLTTYCNQVETKHDISIVVDSSGVVRLADNWVGDKLTNGNVNTTGEVANASITVQSLSRGTVTMPYTAKIEGSTLKISAISGDITSSGSFTLE